MIKYLIPFAGLLVVLVTLSYVSAQQDGEKSDLEPSEFLFRPVYIRHGYHPHNSYGWKGVSNHGGGWGWQPHGYGWGSYHLQGGKKGNKKKAKAKKKAQKKKAKAKKKAQKKGGGGWGGWGGGGGGWGGWGGWGGYGGYGGFEE